MDPNAPVKKPRSPLFYVAIGCGGLMVLILIGVLVLAGAVMKFGKGVVDDNTDPARRLANVNKMLGATPEGYYPVMVLSIPFMMDMTVLGDHPPLEDGGVADFDKGFMYFRVISNEKSNTAKDFFNGDSKDTSALKGSSINVDVEDVLKRGTVKTAGGTAVQYVATRGTMETQGHGKHEGKVGLNTLMYFQCPADTMVRMGVWTMKDPDPGVAAQKLELAGTVADEAEVVKFIAPLAPCGK